MATSVTDSASNRNDKIANYAEALQKSKQLRGVFNSIYRGKKQPKTTEDIQLDHPGISQVRILQLTNKLEHEELIRVDKDGKTKKRVYYKDPFVNTHRKKILGLALNKRKFDALPTKTRPKILGGDLTIKVDLPSKFIDVEQITVDDIESFNEVRLIEPGSVNISPIDENLFKVGIQNILSEKGEFQDWGGEENDLYTTQFKIKSYREPAAFAFKGKGKKVNILRIKDMGKNGDQIPRLFKTAASVFILQYWKFVGEDVVQLMHNLAIAKSATEGRKVFFCIIDGTDSQRLIAAYPKAFKS